MTPQQENRFLSLRSGPCLDVDYIRDYYGLPWPFQGELNSNYQGWLSRLPRRDRCNNSLSRYELEAFMQQRRLLPRKWMGAKLGMTTESFDLLLDKLPEIGLRTEQYVLYGEFVAETLPEDLILNIPALRFRTFYDHNSFCQRLHAEVTSMGVTINSLFCATSEKLLEYPRLYANNFDCLTMEPVSVKHQVWLDFRKPLSLSPDRCSKLFYAANIEALRAFRAGSRDPDDLERYQQYLTEHAHA